MTHRVRRSPARRALQGPAAPRGSDGAGTLPASAGNQAIARALLLRDGPASDAPRILPGLNTPLEGGYAATAFKEQEAVEQRVRAWVAERRAAITGQVVSGLSLPEVVDLIRTGCADALKLAPEAVARLAREAVAPMQIPEHRVEHREKELMAGLRNALSSLPTEAKIGGSGAWATISVSGLEAAAKVGGAELTAEAGPSSASVGVKEGSAEAKLEVDWSEKSIALDTQVGPIGLGGKIGMGASGKPDAWEIHLGVPRAGATGPLLQSTQDAVHEAGNAVTGIIRHLRAGGSPDDATVREHLKAIKKGLEPLGKLTEQHAVEFGISITGDGPNVRVEASLTWHF